MARLINGGEVNEGILVARLAVLTTLAKMDNQLAKKVLRLVRREDVHFSESEERKLAHMGVFHVNASFPDKDSWRIAASAFVENEGGVSVRNPVTKTDEDAHAIAKDVIARYST